MSCTRTSGVSGPVDTACVADVEEEEDEEEDVCGGMTEGLDVNCEADPVRAAWILS